MPRLSPATITRSPSAKLVERPPFWWVRWVPAFALAALLLSVAFIVGRVAVVPVLASFALAYILNPIVETIERRGFSRLISAFLALALVSLLMAAFVYFVVPDLWDQFGKATEIILSKFTEENAKAARIEIRNISPILDRMIGWRIYQFLRSPETLIETSRSWAAGSLTEALSTAAGLLDLLLIPFFVFYILVDFPKWRDSSEALIPPRFREPFSRLFDEVGRILQAYVLGQLMIAIIMGVLYAIGFAFFQVPAWPGIAALSGFLNVIPYVGTGAGIVLACGFTFASGAGIWTAAGVLMVFVAVQSIEGYYLTPKILGDRLKLHPMAVFLGLLIGGKIFGFLGVLLAVPTIAVAMVFFKFLRELYKSSEFYQAGEIGPSPAPAQVEEIIARAADTVLADQVDKQKGDEVLAPAAQEDDLAAREKVL